MNWPEVFVHMKAGTSLDEAHQKAVEAALEKYPFFALGRMMAAKIATKLGDPRAQGLRFLASLYAPSRQYYAFFLEERFRPRVPPPPRLTPPVPSSRESSTPPAGGATSKKDEPSSSDDTGAEGMALSSAFWPPLHGWIRARMRLYARRGEALWEQLTYPPLPSLPSPETSISPEPLKASFPEPTPLPQEPLTELDETPAEEKPSAFPETTQAIETTEAGVSFADSAQAEDMAQVSQTPSLVSPPESVLLSQAPEWPEPPTKPAEERPLKPEEGTSPASVTFGSLYLQFELPLQPSPPSKTSPEPPPRLEETRGTSALGRSYIPLENVEAPVHLPVPEPESPPPQELMMTSSLRGTFVPLENPEARIHLDSPSSEELYSSESPIRSFVPLDIDVQASIHLPVPEPTESSETSFSFVKPSPAEEQKTEPTSETGPQQPSFLIQRGWQSFLAELQQMPLPSEKPLTARNELENLRRQYIKRLLEKRVIRPIAPPKPEPNSLIDHILEKLESFPKTPPSEEGTVELSVPTWEPPSKAPRIYTETMARLYWSQGDLARAIEVYETLCQRHPEKAAYYRSQIERIRAGESPA
ncbi:MAG: hypothetical protein D6750_03500 [Bacteroidetes bacterium]|nr:MAG: hypothetical protein D6750_03500 [Bacteroidota bacterium]